MSHRYAACPADENFSSKALSPCIINGETLQNGHQLIMAFAQLKESSQLTISDEPTKTLVHK